MCCEDFFLSLKANNELFNFLQQATLLLTFASSLLSFFAFRSTPDESGFQQMQQILQAISMGLWAFSSFLIFTVLMAYMWESRYQPAKNAWGEIIYSQKGARKYNENSKAKKLKRQKLVGRNNKNNDKNVLLLTSISPTSSTYGSSNTPPFRSLGTSPTNMSTSDVIVNMNSVGGSSVKIVEESCW